MIDIRMIQEEDAQAYRSLRLRALREHPEAFAASFEETQDVPVEQVADQLRSSTPDRCILGAFGDEELVGFVGFSRHPRPKTRHKSHIGGMYVAPAARKQGTGRALLDAVVVHARSVPGVEEVVLAVTVGNEQARRLYIATGFEPYCVEPRYIKLGAEYFDIEWMILQL